MAQPNIIVCALDDVGREQIRELGFDAGNTYPTLPRLSKLIQDGVRFTRAYSQPWCSPTRTMWHLGLMGYQSGVTQLTENQQPLMERFTALPAAIKIATNNAYRCAEFGKHHMGDYASDGGEHQHPIRIGYDYYAGHMRNLLQGESFYSWPCTISQRTRTGIKTETKLVNEWTLDWLVRNALDWVGQEPTKPFFLYFAPGNCHDPHARPPAEQYDVARYGLPTKHQIPGVTTLPNGLPAGNAFFKANIEASDYALGQLLDGLPQQTRANTVVIWWTDNGTDSGAINPGADPAKVKQTCWEQGVNVPLVVSGPGVARPGRASNVLVSPADLYQTCIDLTGGTTPVPQSGGCTRQSFTFNTFLVNPQTLSSNRSYLIADIFSPNLPHLNASLKANRAIVTDRSWKIMRFNGIGTGGWPSGTGGTPNANFKLFNVGLDPMELTDLIGSSSPFLSGGLIQLTNTDPFWGAALTNYNLLVGLYATSMSSF